MTLADVFSTDYGFNVEAGGLAYLGLGFGFLAATLFGAKFGGEIYNKVRWQSPFKLSPTFFSLYFSACRKEWRCRKARDAHSSAMCGVPVCSCWSSVRTLLGRISESWTPLTSNVDGTAGLRKRNFTG